MKVIDLLNKIANGEKVPNKIKCAGVIYNYEFQDTVTGAYEYRSQNHICLMNNMAGHLYLTDILNSEVEIIEENKEDDFSGIRYFANGNCYMSIASEPPKIQDITIAKEIEKLNKKHFHKRQRQLANKINELIDEINKLNKN